MKYHNTIMKILLFVLAGLFLLLSVLYPFLLIVVIGLIVVALRVGKPPKSNTTQNDDIQTQKNYNSTRPTVAKTMGYKLITDYKELPDRLVFIDFETTGLYCSHDRVVEVGIVVSEDLNIVDEYCQLINPGMSISAEATRINKITNDMVRDMPRIEEIAHEICSRVKDQVIVGYNINFDVGFLLEELFRCDIEMDDIRAFDVLQLVRDTIPSKEMPDRKLKTVKEYFEIKADSHRSLDDCHTTFEIFKRCVRLQENVEMQTKADQAERLAKLNDMEKAFIKEVEDRLKLINLGDKLTYDVKSDRVINFQCGNYQFGRIKLRGKQFKMQLLDKTNVMWIDIDTLEEAILNLKHWIKYCEYLHS